MKIYIKSQTFHRWSAYIVDKKGDIKSVDDHMHGIIKLYGLRDDIKQSYEEGFGKKIDWYQEMDFVADYVDEFTADENIFCVVDIFNKRVYVRPNKNSLENPSSLQMKSLSDWAIEHGWDEDIEMDWVLASRKFNIFKKSQVLRKLNNYITDNERELSPLESLIDNQYFHGSYDELPEGTILTPEKGNFMGTFSRDEMDSHFKLEQFRPSHFLSRDNAVFISRNIDDIDLSGGATEHIYVVEPLGRIEPHDLNWMSEIDLIMDDAWSKGIQESEETIQRVENAALNYWNGVPHYNESVWEFLVPSARITKEIDY